MKKKSRNRIRARKQLEMESQQPYGSPNSKGFQPIPVETLRWLHSYGLKLVGSRTTHGFAVFDRNGCVVHGQGYNLYPEQIELFLTKLQSEHPHRLPAGAAGVIFPDLWEKCEAVYASKEENYFLLQRLINAYPDEYAFALMDWKELQMSPKTHCKSHVELDEIIRRIFNNIRARKKQERKDVESALI